MGKSKKIIKKEYYLKCIPTGYHTSEPPSSNGCDYCNLGFENIYCLEFYKAGIISNVSSYIKRLEKESLTD